MYQEAAFIQKGKLYSVQIKNTQLQLFKIDRLMNNTSAF